MNDPVMGPNLETALFLLKSIENITPQNPLRQFLSPEVQTIIYDVSSKILEDMDINQPKGEAHNKVSALSQRVRKNELN